MIQIYDAKALLEELLSKEDTTGDKKITVVDTGDKKIVVIVSNEEQAIEGTYALSNLLQELALAIQNGKDKDITIPLDRIYEKPSYRVSRMIRDKYWNDLTRVLDSRGLMSVLKDDKMKSETFYIYVPFNDSVALSYYQDFAKQNSGVTVVCLPEKITPEYVLSINDKPGVLSLVLYEDEQKEVKGYPFIVPGGRFNEFFGWDSYFIAIGLQLDKKPHLIKGTLENYRYEIEHYGSILTANRSYFMTRSNPPFFSSMLVEYIENQDVQDVSWIAKMLSAVIKDYETVWLSKTRLCDSGLSRYYGDGIGYVPETEKGHFREETDVYAKQFNMPVAEFEKKYTNRELVVPELDDFFVHDRSLRESGHDTSSRLVNRCAHLNTVDLNALLYKYETDIAKLIETFFENAFESSNGNTYTTAYWIDLAAQRKGRMDTYLWNEKEGTFNDYDFVTKESISYAAPSVLFPLWAKSCSSKQAALLVKNVLPFLTCKGGVAGCSKEVRGNHPERQWDYPYGWAPHQMIVWKGLLNYGYENEVQELVYRWLWLITKEAVDYNGTITEKYDVVQCTHRIDVEYGNQGVDFEYIPDGGFGWMNASYQLGISILSNELRNKLDKLVDPDVLFEN